MKLQNKAIKRILSVFLATMFIVASLPLTGVLINAVPATSGPIKVTDPEGNVTYGFYDWGADQTYNLSTVFTHAPNGSTIQLTRNLIDNNQGSLNNNTNFVLDLNGYVIQDNRTAYDVNTLKMSVNGGCTLTIIDSNPTIEHKYVVGAERWTWNDSASPASGCQTYHYEDIIANNTVLHEGDVVIVKGGAIVGPGGHGIDVNANGTMIIKGGNLIGWKYGSIYVTRGNLTIENVNICGNSVDDGYTKNEPGLHSGGLTASGDASTICIIGGSICYNSHGTNNGNGPNTIGTGGVAISGGTYQIDTTKATIHSNVTQGDLDSYSDSIGSVYINDGTFKYGGDYAITLSSTTASFRTITYMNGSDEIFVSGAPSVYKVGTGISASNFANITPSLNASENEVFDGWYTSANGGTRVESISSSETNNITLYAHISTPLTHNITYIVNSSEVNFTGAITSYVEGVGVSIADFMNMPHPPVNSSAGEYFQYWEYSNGTACTYIPTTATSDITLYAHIVTYHSITYVKDSETITIPGAPTRFIEGEGISSNDLDAVKPLLNTGETFDGWYTQASGGTKITNIDPSTTTNVTLYAHISSVNLTFTKYDTGGYISNDGGNTKTPIVGFGYEINQSELVSSVTSYGVYIYRPEQEGDPIDENNKVQISSDSIQDLINNNGHFYSYVTSPEPIYFCAKGYAVVNGTTYFSTLHGYIGNYETYLYIDSHLLPLD